MRCHYRSMSRKSSRTWKSRSPNKILGLPRVSVKPISSFTLNDARAGVVGFIVGLAILVVFFTQSILLGVVGVAVMLLSSLVVARNAELMGRTSSSRQRHKSG